MLAANIREFIDNEEGVAIFEYAMILGAVGLLVALTLPKYAAANDNAFKCAAGGMDSPVTCTGGVAAPNTTVAATTPTSTTTTTTIAPTTTASSTQGCHYDNGQGNAGYNHGVVCTPTGNSNAVFNH